MFQLSALRRLSSSAGKCECAGRRWRRICERHVSPCQRLGRPCESRAFRHAGNAPWMVQSSVPLWMIRWNLSWHLFICATSFKNNAVCHAYCLGLVQNILTGCYLEYQHKMFEYQHNMFYKEHIKWLGNETINWFYNETWNRIDFEIELRESGVWSD